ncbi:MAG: hypothetical protein J6K97_00855 [Clostridia bacterium]|nr:hypothetical protein [Clostridia bacterium]
MQEKKKRLGELLCKLFEKDLCGYLNVFQEACLLYREIYVEPIFKSLGLLPAPLTFSDSMKRNVATFNGSRVCINLNRVLDLSGGYYGRKKSAVEGIMSVGHEYRHNIQKLYADCLRGNKPNILLKAYLGDIADQLGMAYLDHREGRELYGEVENRNEARAMLTLFPNLLEDVKKEIANKGLRDIIKICNEAIYHQHLIERDARAEEHRVFKIFIEDMKGIIDNREVLNELERCLLSAETKEYNSNVLYQPIVKKISHAHAQMSPKDFKKFGFNMRENQIKGMIAMQYEGENVYQLEYEDQLEIMKDAIKIFGDRHIDLSNPQSRSKALDEIRLLFIKHGFNFDLDYIFWGFPSDDVFELLKEEDVTSESFDEVRLFSDKEVNEILASRTKKGQTIFVEKALEYVDKKSLSKIMAFGSQTLKRKVESGEVCYMTNIYEEMSQNNILTVLKERLSFLKQKFQEKKILFDDVDDYIKMLAAFCKKMGIDYVEKVLPAEGSDIQKDVEQQLLHLYEKAEALACEIASVMKGYRLSEEEYSYASPADRKPFLLSGGNADARVKILYGQTEYDRIQNEKRIMREYIEENLNN